jgi:hypothetical protein
VPSICRKDRRFVLNRRICPWLLRVFFSGKPLLHCCHGVRHVCLPTLPRAAPLPLPLSPQRQRSISCPPPPPAQDLPAAEAQPRARTRARTPVPWRRRLAPLGVARPLPFSSMVERKKMEGGRRRLFCE